MGAEDGFHGAPVADGFVDLTLGDRLALVLAEQLMGSDGDLFSGFLAAGYWASGVQWGSLLVVNPRSELHCTISDTQYYFHIIMILIVT